MKKYRVHHLKFFNPDVRAIHCLAYEKHFKKLAVSRSDNSIEIWNLCATCYQEKVVIGDVRESVEALVWCGKRLFSAGLQGYVVEYDLQKLCPKSRDAVIGGPTWCLSLSFNKLILAAGAESGNICLFDIVPDGIKYLKTFSKQEGRVLSLSWHKSDEFIVTGSIDVITVWNVKSGLAVQTMTAGRTERNKETIIWCVHFLSDHTVVSGDSRGKVCFWNGRMGTLVESMQSHKADVLTLAVDDMEEKIYCAGVDPVIIEISRVLTHHENVQKKQEWMMSFPRNIHTHDIRSLTVADNFLVSGGVDSYLVLSKYSPKVCLKYPQLNFTRCIHVSPKSKLILLQYRQHLEVWRLGNSNDVTGMNGQILNLSQEPIKLLELKCKTGEQIICSAISDDGSWLSYATAENIKLYNFFVDEQDGINPHVRLIPVRCLPSECISAHHLAFVPECQKLLIATPSGELQIMTVDPLQSVLCHTFKSSSNSIHLLCVSDDGRFVAVANHDSMISVYDLADFKDHCLVPRYKRQPSAMSIEPSNDKLLIVYTDHRIVEFDLYRKEYTDWSRGLKDCVHSSWINQSNVVTNIAFDPNDTDTIILHGDNAVTIVDKSVIKAPALKVQKKDSHIKKGETTSGVELSNAAAFRICKMYKHLVYFGLLSDDQMVAVEITPSSIFERLPPALKQKKFGI